MDECGGKPLSVCAAAQANMSFGSLNDPFDIPETFYMPNTDEHENLNSYLMNPLHFADVCIALPKRSKKTCEVYC